METIQNSNTASAAQATARPVMGLAQAVKTCLRKYFDFTGRARRSEYWWFLVFYVLVRCLCGFLEGFFMLPHIGDAVSLLLVVPSYAVLTRRLHDVGYSGWWVLAVFVLECAMLVVAAMTGKITWLQLLTNNGIDAMFQIYNVSSLTWVMSAAMVLLNLFMLVLSLVDSFQGVNKYGDSPKYQ